MTKTPCFSLDYYDKSVIQRIMDKYALSPMDASRAFLTSKTHAMLENPDMAMWEFSDRAIFDIWEAEQVTGDTRNSIYIRSEME